RGVHPTARGIDVEDDGGRSRLRGLPDAALDEGGEPHLDDTRNGDAVDRPAGGPARNRKGRLRSDSPGRKDKENEHRYRPPRSEVSSHARKLRHQGVRKKGEVTAAPLTLSRAAE